MGKPVSVFSHTSNPSIDPPKFHASFADADHRVKHCHHRRISERAIQEPEPEGYTRPKFHAGFDSAWGSTQSGYGGPLVMQMRSTKVFHVEL